MREYITTVRRHNSNKWEVAIPPSAPLRAHRQFLKPLRGSKTNEDLEEIRFSSVVRKYKFKPSPSDRTQPKPEPAATPVQPPAKAPGPVAALANRFRGRAAASRKTA